MATAPDSSLVRALGRRDLTAFAVNRIIGGGIFGLPAILFAGVGVASVAAVLLAAVVALGVALCFAEVGSRYRASGGPYLYASDTFGPIVGFEIGWLMWLAQLGGYAAVLNLFVNYASRFAPGIGSGPGRAAAICAVTVALAAVNVVGVQRAALLNNVLTAAKLLPLALFVVVGLAFVEGARLAPAAAPTLAAMAGAVLLAIYAFSGFEVVGVPGGEVDDPARTIPFALLAGLAIVTVIYAGVQVVAVGTLPGLAVSDRPLAEAAERIAGQPGAVVMVIGALLSTLGVAHAILLAAGRMPFAMAERRQLPAVMAAVHPRFRTPHAALLFSAGCMLLFTLATTFAAAVTITVGLRVTIYVVTCLALPVLRKRSGTAPFSAPAGPVLALVCALVSLGLLASQPRRDIIQLVVVVALGLPAWAACTNLGKR